MFRFPAALIALSLASLPSVLAAAEPLVIAHRGASGLRPEHTLAAYDLAIAQGADFIETDLVMTRDRQLVARHENEISGTTDIAAHPEFADRKRTRTIDGQSITGWFTEDFTLAELRGLKARERLPELRPQSAAHDGEQGVPTLAEVVALIRKREAELGRRIGLYAEIKHGHYFQGIGLAMEAPVAAELARLGYKDKADPMFIESFEVNNLKALRKLTGVRLVQLLDETGAPADGAVASYAAMTTPEGLAAIAAYADGIGPAKAQIIPRDADGRSLPPTTLVADAHRAGLVVHPWTFRSENAFLPTELHRGEGPAAHGDAAAEVRQFIAAGVDGLFSDYPGEAVAARKAGAEEAAASAAAR